ncbi:MAG: hypothetical protein DRI57_15735, partial [Deltaproteobacteria bacterium]
RTESIFYQYYQYIQYNDLIFRLIPAEGRAPFCVKGGTHPNLCCRGLTKHCGRGCKPRPADYGLIKTVSYNLSLMHMP